MTKNERGRVNLADIHCIEDDKLDTSSRLLCGEGGRFGGPTNELDAPRS